MIEQRLIQVNDAGGALTSPGGPVKPLTKTVIETTLDEEGSERLG